MGLFDSFFKKEVKKDLEVFQPEIHDYGWNSIEKEFLRVYPGQNDPKHYGTLVGWKLGGKDPLDGISIYESDGY